MKICIVSSCGGHLTEVRALKSAYSQHDYFYVLNDQALLSDDMTSRTFFMTHSERDWRFFLNLWEAFALCRKHRPHVILSTGAGPAVPMSLVARYCFGSRIVFIETITRVDRPSITGRIMYYLAHDFFYQWKGLEHNFPKGKYAGPLV